MNTDREKDRHELHEFSRIKSSKLRERKIFDEMRDSDRLQCRAEDRNRKAGRKIDGRKIKEAPLPARSSRGEGEKLLGDDVTQGGASRGAGLALGYYRAIPTGFHLASLLTQRDEPLINRWNVMRMYHYSIQNKSSFVTLRKSRKA